VVNNASTTSIKTPQHLLSSKKYIKPSTNPTTFTSINNIQSFQNIRNIASNEKIQSDVHIAYPVQNIKKLSESQKEVIRDEFDYKNHNNNTKPFPLIKVESQNENSVNPPALVKVESQNDDIVNPPALVKVESQNFNGRSYNKIFNTPLTPSIENEFILSNCSGNNTSTSVSKYAGYNPQDISARKL
jgi:hypothetical protein